MRIITNDERFEGESYRDWLLQDPSTDGGRLVTASAVGCVAQAMTVLTGAGLLFRICAGASEHSVQYVLDGLLAHRVMVQHATIYTSAAVAERVRKQFEKHHFDGWASNGGLRCPKYWSVPFLVAVP